MRKVILICVILLIGSSAYAQSPVNVTPSSRIGWDQQASSLAEAQGLIFRYYLDGSTNGVVFANVTCSPTATGNIFLCSTTPPSVTPGNHSLQLTAGNIAGESAKSSPFAYVYILTPVSPVNLRVLPPGSN